MPLTDDVLLRKRELRGDHTSHSFHGNQHTGGKGGGGHSSLKVMGNVVIGPGGPQTSKEYAFALRTAGYKGPLSYPKGKLKELYDVHVKGSTTSVDIGHSAKSAHQFAVEAAAKAGAAKTPDMTHKGVDYSKMTGDNESSQDARPGSIKVMLSGNVQYKQGDTFVPAGPGTTAAFKDKSVGIYEPHNSGVVKPTGANIAGQSVPGHTPITTSVKPLAHEVDAATSHAVGERNWKAGFETQHSAAIKAYSGSYSGSINASMQNGTPNKQATDMHNYIKTKGHQLDEKITVDRGISGPHATALKNVSAGSTIEYKSFASTTYSQVGTAHHSVAAHFGHGNVVMRITVPKDTRVGIGTHGATHHSAHGPMPGGEKEIILPPGKFRVSHISENAKFTEHGASGTIVHLEYLGAT